MLFLVLYLAPIIMIGPSIATGVMLNANILREYIALSYVLLYNNHVKLTIYSL